MNIWNLIKEKLFLNYWVSPFIITLLFMLFGFATIRLDHSVDTVWKITDHIPLKDNIAQSILTMIGASLISVTAVLFSVTILTLSIASNQLGPRLIPNFIKNGKTQMAIGLYIGTFVYVLVILSYLGFSNNTPIISIVFSLTFAIACFLVLIYIIHYICQAIQIEYILEQLKNECFSLLSNQSFINSSMHGTNHEFNTEILKNSNNHILTSSEFGFLQLINLGKLIKISKNESVTIELLVRPGQFINKKEPISKIHGLSYSKALEEKIHSCFNIGLIRSTTQDIEFVFEQISEIAIRAISPSINNPYTAILCIDYLTECIITLSFSKITNGIYVNEDKSTGVIIKNFTYEGIINIAFDRLRQQAIDDLSVSIKLLNSIEKILSISKNEVVNNLLTQQAETIFSEVRTKIKNDKDMNDFNESYHKIKVVHQPVIKG